MQKDKIKYSPWELNLGASYKNGKTFVTVWAPHHAAIHLVTKEGLNLPMKKEEKGYFTIQSDQLPVGTQYKFLFENGESCPDPVSRELVGGVHGYSRVVDPLSYRWNDKSWRGVAYKNVIFYELHIGTFSDEGTFEGAIEKLAYLSDLGITMIELMPVSTFPGRWNWGYDGVSLYAPFEGYGGYEGFKRFVDSAHQKGIGICLDVVYNHLGPEGNYLPDFGPYFSSLYHTPWGKGLNYDAHHSDEVKRFIMDNVCYWFSEFHLDALRLDAIHGIYDFSPLPLIAQISQKVQQLSKDLGRPLHLIAENALNDTRTIKACSEGGMGLQGMWNDDFHHALHVFFTGEVHNYYSDFAEIKSLQDSISKGFAYDGVYSNFFKRTHGNSTKGIPLERFIAFAQNHDQVGNRPKAKRINQLIPKDQISLLPFFVLMTPQTPLLFMGEEYGEQAPFCFFVDFSNENLMRSVHEGRLREFKNPDMLFPGKDSFQKTHLSWEFNDEILSTYKKLISLRKKYPAKQGVCQIDVEYTSDGCFTWSYPTDNGEVIGVAVNRKGEKEWAPPFQGELLYQESSGRASVWLINPKR